MKHAVSVRWLAIQTVPVAICLTSSGAHMNLSMSRFSCSLSGHQHACHSCWLLNLEWSLDFEHVIQSLLRAHHVFLVSVVRSTIPNYLQVKYRCPYCYFVGFYATSTLWMRAEELRCGHCILAMATQGSVDKKVLVPSTPTKHNWQGDLFLVEPGINVPQGSSIPEPGNNATRQMNKITGLTWFVDTPFNKIGFLWVGLASQ